ncbi:MAG: dTDP-4-dehydrorhamnose 3,5-epimerase family protein [Fibrobacteria bacterium]|nr:dTDP-4-dehydrorhamnose 3,5-epimerase family protein [Fibrobacteria bacterium]
MKFIEQQIEGVWLIEPEPFRDDRGALRRHFCQKEFSDHGITSDIAQGNISENINAYTLRGFHYQISPFEESKTLSCYSGSLYDVVVDLRPESSTFLKWVPLTIDAEKKQSIHVPSGCANAYLTLDINTCVHYYMSEFYHPGSYRGFRYNDPFFNITWPREPEMISEKDKGYSDFNPAVLETSN